MFEVCANKIITCTNYKLYTYIFIKYKNIFEFTYLKINMLAQSNFDIMLTNCHMIKNQGMHNNLASDPYLCIIKIPANSIIHCL